MKSPDIARITAAAAAIDELTAKLIELRQIRHVFAETARGYALGAIPLSLAAAAVVASAADRAEIQNALRSAVKRLRNETLESLSDLVMPLREAALKVLKDRCSNAEKAERAAAEEALIHPDHFVPSPALRHFRSAALTAKSEMQMPVRITELEQLLAMHDLPPLASHTAELVPA